jgi:hypothetical protein
MHSAAFPVRASRNIWLSREAAQLTLRLLGNWEFSQGLEFLATDPEARVRFPALQKK